MPVLLDDGTIRYESLDELRTAAEKLLSGSGLLLESGRAWPLRMPIDFNIMVAGHEFAASLRAEAVYCQAGLVGLEIIDRKAASKALNDLARRLSAPGPSAAQKRPAVSAVTNTAREDEPVAAEKHVAPIPTVALAAAIDIHGQLPPGTGSISLRTLSPVAISADGLHQIDLFDLIASLASAGTALALTIEQKNRQLRFGFNDKGNIIHYIASGAQQDLVERLVSAQLIPRSRKHKLLAAASDSKPVEAVIMEEKIVKLSELWVCVRDQVVDALEDVRHSGASRFNVRSHQTARRTGVSFGQLIIPWLVRALGDLDPAKQKELLAPFSTSYPRPNKNCRWPLSVLNLDRKSLRFAEELLDGTRTLTDALNAAPQVRRKELRLLSAALYILGTIELLDRSLASTERSPEYRLSKELDGLSGATRFEQAGVHWSAHPSTYKEALQKIRREYGKAGKLASYSAECAAMCRKRISMAEAAYEYIENRDRRKQHRKQVVEASQLQMSAAMLFKQVDMLLFRNDILQARRNLEIAVELNPEPEYVKKLQELG